MNQVETSIQCPYCGENIDILLDPSVPQQEYIEDCQVCCRPIIIELTFFDDESPTVNCHRDDE